MPNTVLKPFNSLNRRFAAGDRITEVDIDPGSASTLKDWIARGFVAADGAPAAPKPGFFKSPEAATADQTQTA